MLRWALAQLPNLGEIPVGTMAANVAGAFVLALLLTLPWPRAEEPRFTAVTAGLLGAATTFSTFILEVVLLWPDHPGLAQLYLLASVAAGLAAAVLGRHLAGRRVVST